MIRLSLFLQVLNWSMFLSRKHLKMICLYDFSSSTLCCIHTRVLFWSTDGILYYHSSYEGVHFIRHTWCMWYGDLNCVCFTDDIVIVCHVANPYIGFPKMYSHISEWLVHTSCHPRTTIRVNSRSTRSSIWLVCVYPQSVPKIRIRSCMWEVEGWWSGWERVES